MKLFVCVLFSFSAFISVAAAGSCDPACQAARKAAAQAPYNGPLKPANEPMACVRVVAYGHSEVVWINGTSENYVTAPVIYRQGRASGHSEKFALAQNLRVVESCIPRRLLKGVKHLTLCNGVEVGKGFHWQVHSSSLSGLKKTGHSGTYHPLISTEHRMSFSPDTVRRVYRQRYLGG